MKKILHICLIALSSFSLLLGSVERGSSEPYISGDSFREHCDFIFDETDQSINPADVGKGDVIFVKTDLLPLFFSMIHPEINEKYILLSHNSDHPAPDKFAEFLDDEKIIAWFAQNVENYSHPKLHHIPIGFANKCWKHGDVTIINDVLQTSLHLEKNVLLYMNFLIATRIDERSMVASMFQNQSYCVIESPKEYQDYLIDLAHSKFVLSPRGNGLDCHRTWESLLMGAIPIVKTSSLDPMYQDLPVLIVQDWSEINYDFLLKKYKEISSKNYSNEKIYFSYWLNLIQSYKS